MCLKPNWTFWNNELTGEYVKPSKPSLRESGAETSILQLLANHLDALVNFPTSEDPRLDHVASLLTPQKTATHEEDVKLLETENRSDVCFLHQRQGEKVLNAQYVFKADLELQAYIAWPQFPSKNVCLMFAS